MAFFASCSVGNQSREREAAILANNLGHHDLRAVDRLDDSGEPELAPRPRCFLKRGGLRRLRFCARASARGEEKQCQKDRQLTQAASLVLQKCTNKYT